jgi:hypothetical protein
MKKPLEKKIEPINASTGSAGSGTSTGIIRG